MTDTDTLKPFNGTKRLYKRVALVVSISSVFSVYCLFIAAKYFLVGDTTYLDIKSIVSIAAFALIYAFVFYRIMLNTDRGKRHIWKLEETTIKLPETKRHQKFG